MSFGRRAFLAALAAAGAGCAARRPDTGPAPVPDLDFHVHLFGIGDEGTGCRMSPRQRRHWTYPFFLRLLGLSENGRMDRDFVAELVRQLAASATRRVVLLAQDGRYDERGRFDEEATHAYVPNDYLFAVVRERPDLFVAGASVNPRRRDALDEVDRCAEAGARVVKVHPPTQAVDPAEERFRPFYRRLAERGLVLVVHTGSEHASAVADDRWSDPARLVPALEEGCTVVAAHAGMGSFLDARPFRDDFVRNLSALAATFPRLYCDTAVLAAVFRWRNLPRLLADPALAARAVYASDWPFTSNALVFWNRVGPRALVALAAERNLFDRDAALKHALGLPRDVFARGPRVLELAAAGAGD